MMLDLPDAAKAATTSSRVGKLLISSAPARRETKLAILELFPNGRCSSCTAAPRPAG